MDLLPSPEQQQIIDSTAAFIEGRMPLRRLHGRTGPADIVPAALWAEIAGMGWLGMSIDETQGGVGYGAAEETLVFWQLGRALAPPRILFTALAARAAASAGAHELARRLVAGEAAAALAVQDDYADDVEALSRRRLFEAKQADLALAVDGERVRLLDLAQAAIELREGLDKSVSMGLADLSSAPVLCDVRDESIERAGALLSAALMVGAAETVTSMTVAYAKIRETFGRPIGAYQAVRHPCAEMAARCELAKAQLFMAAVGVDAKRLDVGLLASAARVLAEHAALQNADDAIQLHGGIGVTEEFDTHFFIKRANVMASWFGDRRLHLARIVEAPTQLAEAR